MNPAVPPPVRVRTGGGNARDATRSEGAWYSDYLLYWYKSTNTGEEGGATRVTLSAPRAHGTQITCFTGTKVQILAKKALQGVLASRGDASDDAA